MRTRIALLAIVAGIAVACGRGDQGKDVQPDVLLDDVGAVFDLAVDADSAYLLAEYQGISLLRLPLGTTSAQTLAAPVENRTSLVLSEGHVFWMEGSGTPGEIARLFTVPASGGTPMVLATALASQASASGGLYPFAADSLDVYVVQSDGSTLARIPIAGGNAAVLTTGGVVWDPILDADYIYGNDRVTETVSRAPRTGGALEPIYVAPFRAFALAVDATDLYWTQIGLGGIVRAPKDGSGAPQTIAEGEYISKILVDGEEIFWYRYDPEASRYCIYRGRIDGSQKRTVWCQDDPILALALDSERIYFGGLPTALQSLPR